MIVLLKASRIHFLKQATIPEKSNTNLEIETTTTIIIIIKPGFYLPSLYIFMS